MKLKSTLLTLLAVFSGTILGLARSGVVLAPSFAAPDGCPPQVMKQVRAALNRGDCKFVRGEYVNRSTHLRYSGGTKALNEMLAELTKCPGVVLTIETAEKFNGPGDWSVSSQPGSNQFLFHVVVNLQSERIKREELRVPELKTVPLKTVSVPAAK
ncbi:MAG TPA: hypothetical protein VFV83_06400 [Chthoniobacteraceae bacterium]|nr:hypothetical protein [Chthoniobacteraceae bacterium]